MLNLACRRAITLLSVSAASVALLQAPAAATETIKITAIDGYSPKSMWVREFINFYIPEIDKERLAKTGNYKIDWNQAWGGQIVKVQGCHGWSCRKGLGDIGVVTTVFHADKVPLQMIAYATPFVTTDPKFWSRVRSTAWPDKHFPEYKAAFAKFNQVYLTNLAVLDTYQIFSAKRRSRTLRRPSRAKRSVAPVLTCAGSRASAPPECRWQPGDLLQQAENRRARFDHAVAGIGRWPQDVRSCALYAESADLGTVNSKAITVNSKTRGMDLPA